MKKLLLFFASLLLTAASVHVYSVQAAPSLLVTPDDCRFDVSRIEIDFHSVEMLVVSRNGTGYPQTVVIRPKAGVTFKTRAVGTPGVHLFCAPFEG